MYRCRGAKPRGGIAKNNKKEEDKGEKKSCLCFLLLKC